MGLLPRGADNLMSALGQKQTNRPGPKFGFVRFGPIADKRRRHWNVRFVPIADIRERYSITSSSRETSSGGTVRSRAFAVLRLITNSCRS